MTIKSFKIIKVSIQGGGEQRTEVVFTDHLGIKHYRSYDLQKDSDINKEVEIRKAGVEQGLKDQDIEKAVSSIEAGKPFALQYAEYVELKLRLQDRELEKQEEITRFTDEKAKVSAELEVKK